MRDAMASSTPHTHGADNRQPRSPSPSPSLSSQSALLDPLPSTPRSDRLRTLSRSPHPYHRIGSRLVDQLQTANLSLESSTRSSRRTARTSSDSGTEADDESTGLLKGLPAPPVRSRKGLRNRGSRDDDPAHDYRPGWSLFVTSAGGGSSSAATASTRKKRSSSEESTRISASARQVVALRKRNEILRRMTETALLASVGGIVLLREDVRSFAYSWHREICIHISLVITLYALYPLRISFWRRKPRVTFSFCIPSSFDPAPLLYPVVIPVYVALSASLHQPTLLLPNIILGLSSIPPQVIPFYRLHHGLSVCHWTVACIPVLLADHAMPLSLRKMDPELLLLLFPLHQALIPTLNFLLTTSLLPAELHLLGTGLINLFLFADSPQAEILKALLWLGGLSVWVLCRTVLRWEITLARIPSWKFRRPPNSSLSPKKLINFLDHKLCEKVGGLGTHSEDHPDSDSDDADTAMVSTTRQRSFPSWQDSFFSRREVSSSANEGGGGSIKLDDLWPTSWASTKQLLVSHKRRHTISTLDTIDTVRPKRPRMTPGGRRKRSVTPDLASFLSLTAAQARVRRWLYAGYIFGAVLLIILVPIRKYVADRALYGSDPFGWALGYMFGNISSFRLWTVMWNLEHWIQLPVRRDEPYCHAGWMEHIRHNTFGEASTRLLISGYCAVVLLVGMAVVLQLSKVAEVDTRRKVFHGMMVLMFLPITYIDPAFAGLALALVLSIFLLLDLFRASQVPPVAKPLTYFLAPYTDGRDHRGPVIVSHIFLLIGCAIPLWLSLTDTPRTGDSPWRGWDVAARDTSMVSGIVCVGMGDAAASLVGRRFGRLKWVWGGGKSLEGSLAFSIAVFVGLMLARVWLSAGGWHASPASWLFVLVKCALAAGGASLTEAVLTGGNDNVIVPVVLWLLTRGLGI
ncbi:hypothetical protein PISL3812_07189 [Talaromyces islandicus]|uniref:dolichol kinase n=1 Tax=Talaromyces islandicus TaxID=28573 RepID=A0A0U1M3K3_TALIS|nr:hypothetical protein PISL3812_07189 [Talaromyces islandicus]